MTKSKAVRRLMIGAYPSLEGPMPRNVVVALLAALLAAGCGPGITFARRDPVRFTQVVSVPRAKTASEIRIAVGAS